MGRKNKNSGDFFWVSYADLMTTLFFIMLTLFILTVVYLKVEQNVIQTKLIEYENILKVKEQFKPLQKKNSGFVYLENCDKYVAEDLLGEEIFEPNKTRILPQFEDKTIQVGKRIQRLLTEMKKNNSGLQYIVILEGNMANRWDMSISKESIWGYKVSYERALAVYDFWLQNGIDMRGNDDVVEVLISGSGFNGLCRDEVEENNKRFSVQIIPKVKPINE